MDEKNKEENHAEKPKDNLSKEKKPQVSDEVLKKADNILPGLGGLFKKAEKSKIFGHRLAEIRKEMERKFSKLKGKK